MDSPILDNFDHQVPGSVGTYSGKNITGAVTSNAGLGYIWRASINGQKVWFIIDALTHPDGWAADMSGFTGRFVVPVTNPPDGRYHELAFMGVNSAGRMIYATTDGSNLVFDTSTNQLRAPTTADALKSTAPAAGGLDFGGTLFSVGSFQVKTWMAAAAAALGLMALNGK